MRCFASVLALSTLLGFCGCGSSGEPVAADSQPANTAASEGKSEGPDRAVFKFLKAVQTGDDQTAAEMLTEMARKKTEELEMVVAPPGSDTASFEVGQVEMIQEGGAYVSSTWTDLDEQGQPHSDQIVWVLRKEPEGWRIAGMVTKLFDNKLVLNFEDPEDMIRKQQLAEQEMIRRSQQQQTPLAQPGAEGQPASQAQQPAIPENPIR